MSDWSTLNPRQLEAVTLPPGPALVLAGAGSGKTRVLTSRIAHLLEEGVYPGEILAVTFTNKAARSMRERLDKMVAMELRGLWMGTFHGLAHRLIRLHHEALKLPADFQVLDSEDSQRLLRRLMREAQMDEKQWPPRAMAGRIGRWKDEGWGPEQVLRYEGPAAAAFVPIYQAYEVAKQRSGLLDFGDLLLYALKLWASPEILDHYQRRFQHILVDEFQDTNAVQYAWLKGLARHGQIFVVGDDDQSIYAWRGARVENLLRFGEDFAGARVVRLEQNYRSTAAILQAANAVIANNPERMGKTLWTAESGGEAVHLYTAYNEFDEARYVIGRIQQWQDQGGRRSDCAILYRSNAQSRAFEEVLVREGLPYRVYGGLRFFERAEIKDTLAYLRLTANRHDDASFERVVNVPSRGIGAVSVERLRNLAREKGLSLWQAAGALNQAKINGFLNLVDTLAEQTQEQDLDKRVEIILQHTALREWHSREGDRAEGRLENLDELINAARAYGQDWHADPQLGELAPQPGNMLSEFLTHAALEAGDGAGDAWEDCVQLMSLHSAKGLEFPLVFLVGLEEGLFPHQRSLEDGQGLAEERRLCYVGMTRAMRLLVLSHAESRRLHGSERMSMPSRFLREIPQELLQDLRPRARISRPAMALRPAAPEMPYPLGSRLQHPVFGEGTVLDYEAGGRQGRIQVQFSSGAKWLALGVVQLQQLP
ncbi:DNA helicase II [Acidithiobacillus thiooxidans]|uniref:DNA 3'-5' helicase n=1 Tax=Acidithiobacillus thiooxidans TaxID=930 RepID=A0A1C2HXS7_ACITH|nr:UvrD-helicase domain-containing protein [Acidithiobacillus thiooxidans]OCX68025.1 DNA helicase II [Acidithiobacillus thiooxidans]OCX68556.1 DNA helicase II [Acidithiobacillus thiooxidans]OCX68962.1 DNA helicase II [Acidithiobacillus thiooxidans]OCX80472.1 DNA helicase II [Acidithiobacillus thiooxidans]OCX85405.1 DNA helicase II [Acidithiobacillus thiooxidans]